MNNRNLRFTNLEQVEEELKKFESARVRTTGLWSFYQILTHCAEYLEFSIKEYPQTGVMLFFVRKLFGKWRLNKTLKQGFMPQGEPNPFAPKRREEGDEKKALARLKKAISDFRAYNGKMAVHPIFDDLDKATWEKLHSIHIANHLGFVYIVEGAEPKDEKNEKVDKIKEELLRNLNSKLEARHSQEKVNMETPVKNDSKVDSAVPEKKDFLPNIPKDSFNTEKSPMNRGESRGEELKELKNIQETNIPVKNEIKLNNGITSERKDLPSKNSTENEKVSVEPKIKQEIAKEIIIQPKIELASKQDSNKELATVEQKVKEDKKIMDTKNSTKDKKDKPVSKKKVVNPKEESKGSSSSKDTSISKKKVVEQKSKQDTGKGSAKENQPKVEPKSKEDKKQIDTKGSTNDKKDSSNKNTSVSKKKVVNPKEESKGNSSSKDTSISKKKVVEQKSKQDTGKGSAKENQPKVEPKSKEDKKQIDAKGSTNDKKDSSNKNTFVSKKKVVNPKEESKGNSSSKDTSISKKKVVEQKSKQDAGKESAKVESKAKQQDNKPIGKKDFMETKDNSAKPEKGNDSKKGITNTKTDKKEEKSNNNPNSKKKIVPSENKKEEEIASKKKVVSKKKVDKKDK